MKDELEKLLKVKAKLVLMVVGTPGAVTPKLGKWFQQMQEQHQSCLSKKVHLLGSTKITAQKSQTPRPLAEDSKLRKTHTTHQGEKGISVKMTFVFFIAGSYYYLEY